MGEIQHKPNFFVVGTVKGGTTSLHRYLSQHPQVYMSPIKETNYFSAEDIDESKFNRDYRHDVNIDLEKFLSGKMGHPIHIAHVTKYEDYLKLFKNVADQVAIGEISNSYLLYEHAASRIKDFDPKAKIVMILRNPMERAFSQYVMNLRLGKTLEKDFLAEIINDNQKPDKGWGASHQYLSVGLYYEQVKRYLDVFPREQVKIYFYDDYQNKQAETIKDLFDFLGVNAQPDIDISRKFNESGVPKYKFLNYFINQFGIISWAKRKMPRGLREPFKKYFYSSDKSKIPVITTEEKTWLINYYHADILNLSGLLKKDLSHWLK